MAEPSSPTTNTCAQSILDPRHKIVAGYQDIMPPFRRPDRRRRSDCIDRLHPSRLESGETPPRVESYPPPTKTPHRFPKKIIKTTEHGGRRLSQPRPTSVMKQEESNYLNVRRGIASWLLTKDHKRIAILYLFPITAMFFIGAVFMAIVRLNLMTPAGRWSRRIPTIRASPRTA